MSKPQTPEDIIKFRTLSDPSVSPDGSTVVISVGQADLENDLYISDIWMVDVAKGTSKKFTTSGKDSDPVWSPDGKSILFTSKRGVAKDEKGNELYVIPADGGEAQRLLKRKEGIDSPVWAPDSQKIAYLSSVVNEEKNDVRVIDRIQFWFNGIGWTHNMRKHLFILDLKDHKSSQLTTGDIDVEYARFSHDGKKLAYIASTDDYKPYISDLFVLDTENNQTKKLTESNMEISSLAWSPDDQLIAFNGSKLPSGFASNSHIWLVSSNGASKPREIENVDRNKGNSLNSDVRSKAHGSHNIIWSDDGYIYFLQADGGDVHLYRTKPGDKPAVCVGGNRSVEGYDIKKGVVTIVSMDASHPEELYLVKDDVVRLTDFNRGVREELETIEPLSFSFNASDGENVDGWLLKPKTSQNKYPVILYVHGGPKTAFGSTYIHEFQVYAANGFAVIFMNPRGSDGYSERFADIRGDYGNRDFKDLMEGLDYVIEKFPFIDAERIGIAGGSYGGFMTNWSIGHTNRFKAAVTDRSIANWISFFSTSDIGPHFTNDQIGGDPWKLEQKLLDMSPLRYIQNVTTPLLIIHSQEDYRCWMVEALQMFTGLKYLQKDVELVLFAGENHDLSRGGKPKHRVARLNHYLRWFNKHLKAEQSQSAE
ncbi:MAG: S9 family peptidase [Nitrososphaerota archaeon]|jgi:dipeptidyl aminopeptidase/acylaminoacyl peptidase|nr:S9 family peptidase [Nitrososphaerota archaeon]